MKYLLSVILLLPLMGMAQPSQTANRTLPTEEELAAIGDSIIEEGTRLYVYESLSWMAADLLKEHAGESMSRITGSAVMVDEDGSLTQFYCSEDSVLFSCSLDLNDFSLSWDNTVRPMTKNHHIAVAWRTVMINGILETYGDRIQVAPDGSLSVDLIWISEDKIRAYLLPRTTLDDVIPFGSDCYVDIDVDGNILDFHQFHHSYIPINVIDEENKQMLQVIHSHTSDNPFFTPTDICISLLYARDFFGMTSTSILSTAFTPSVIMTFNMDDFTITYQEIDSGLDHD